MEILITLDALKNREGEKILRFPPDTLVTKEAKIYCWDGFKIYEPVSNLKKIRENAFIPEEI